MANTKQKTQILGQPSSSQFQQTLANSKDGMPLKTAYPRNLNPSSESKISETLPSPPSFIRDIFGSPRPLLGLSVAQNLTTRVADNTIRTFQAPASIEEGSTKQKRSKKVTFYGVSNDGSAKASEKSEDDRFYDFSESDCTASSSTELDKPEIGIATRLICEFGDESSAIARRRRTLGWIQGCGPFEKSTYEVEEMKTCLAEQDSLIEKLKGEISNLRSGIEDVNDEMKKLDACFTEFKGLEMDQFKKISREVLPNSILWTKKHGGLDSGAHRPMRTDFASISDGESVLEELRKGIRNPRSKGMVVLDRHKLVAVLEYVDRLQRESCRGYP
ncbi:hypothetical protein BJ508DRAFT_340674 [Ascobolus immersus RN42]|uniref:Uncharacterized protein n=1 Tax=Ascobolus immersus RN42 TaxID=1160509 RepID=A0A3N4IDD8_ASCIM|nr:hypothetical protein BJ508DRAFT_340674 [Ascobolus immersus RN42]